MRRFLRLMAGGGLTLFGLIGWFLPVIPGTLLIILGAAILSTQSEWLRNKIQLLKARYPRQVARLMAIKDNLGSKIRKGRSSSPIY